MSVKEGFVEVTGGKVWYQHHNSTANKTPVIILHGGPGSSHYAMQGLRNLAKERPVIFYDQLGCGKSDWPTDTSLWKIDRFVEELGQICDALSLEDFHILGHSWGTTLAAAFYLKKPAGVKSIIFSSPCLSAPLWAKDQEENRKLLPLEIQQTLKKCEENGSTDSEEYKNATKVFNQHFVCRLNPFPEFLKEGKQYQNNDVYNIMWGPSEFHVTGNLKDFDCTSRLKEFQLPTLFTCGRYDEATPNSTEYFCSLTPNGKSHVFEDSAHLAYLEETEEYIRVMDNFMNEVEGSGKR
ncbi:proline iminopeptidase [Bacillus mesophilus]|uniref:Proline iminopeptidase n=1 Tax=Bacillus mesophilus TaxID=1808955 RepID=A0A6M0Q7Y7_9BACI|nr:proline iminopeptidase-family hydrolase [Bacillus mesophilus]MBM7662174.1 proline iminopeptidase [Bacillus mesophilus]NEY72476.1 proline iminopeptidase-family hydrolase [Bacillus mesophilus]